MNRKNYEKPSVLVVKIQPRNQMLNVSPKTLREQRLQRYSIIDDEEE